MEDKKREWEGKECKLENKKGDLERENKAENERKRKGVSGKEEKGSE